MNVAGNGADDDGDDPRSPTAAKMQRNNITGF